MADANTVQSTVTAPIVKVVSAWAAVGITSWAEAASALAALYTFALLIDFIWMKWGRPFCEDRGWIKRKKRRVEDGWRGRD